MEVTELRYCAHQEKGSIQGDAFAQDRDYFVAQLPTLVLYEYESALVSILAPTLLLYGNIERDQINTPLILEQYTNPEIFYKVNPVCWVTM